jgi:hypothetical protein
MRSLALPICAAVLAACAPTVRLIQSGPMQAARRPDCRIDFFRAKQPERAFDEIAVLQYDGRAVDLLALQEVMRKRACAAGADAVVVTREYVAVSGRASMIGTAIRYRDLTPGERAVLDRPRDLAVETPPAGYRAVVVKEGATVHPDAALKKPALSTVPAGTVLWQADASDALTVSTRELKRLQGDGLPESAEVRLPDGSKGFVAAEQLAPYQPAAPADAPSAKPDADAGI